MAPRIRRRCRAVLPIMCALCVALSGCAAALPNLTVRSQFPERMNSSDQTPHRQPQRPSTAPKSSDTGDDDDSYERHPSRWRQKLRAKYA